jgi:hypothetical protein
MRSGKGLSAVLALAVAAASAFAACRRIEPAKLDPVRALRRHVEPRFKAPEDGLLTPAQVDLFLRVRREAGSGSVAEVAGAMRIDPAEFVWVRARIVEALGALDSARVVDAAAESSSRALVALRQARAATHDPKAITRLDGEIAGIEKQRAALRRADPLSPVLQKNAALVAPRRAEIESAGL